MGGWAIRVASYSPPAAKPSIRAARSELLMCSAGAKSNRQSFMCEPRDRTPPAASRHGQLTEVSMSWLAFRYALLHYIHTIQLYKPSTWATPSWTLTRVDVYGWIRRYPLSTERVRDLISGFLFFFLKLSSLDTGNFWFWYADERKGDHEAQAHDFGLGWD